MSQVHSRASATVGGCRGRVPPKSCRSASKTRRSEPFAPPAPGADAFTASERDLLEATAKQAALAIERARLDLQVRGAQHDAETNQLRAALFSSVTHDLRTPLASIKASVTSLLSDDAVHDAANNGSCSRPCSKRPTG